MQIGIDIRPLASEHETGVGAYTRGLLTALFARRRTNKYLLFSNGRKGPCPASSLWVEHGVHVVHRRFPNTLLHASIALGKRPALDRFLPLPIDCWFSPNLHFTALSKTVPQILTIHDLSFEHFPDLFSPKDRLWHRLVRPKEQTERAVCIITPSEHTRQDVIESYGISKDRVVVISPGCPVLPELSEKDAESFLTHRGLVRGRFVLFVGSIESRKNLVGLIEAFRRSSLSNEGFRLVLAGPFGWRSEEVQNEAGDRGDVILTGYVSVYEKAALYRGAALFVYPSIYEGFGLPILEAFASGTPVLTSNRSSLPEVAGNAALLVNPMNIEEIRWGMEEITGNTSLANVYRQAGRARVKDFSWEKAVEELERLFERITCST